MAYDYKESHKHKLAKELLFKWLNDAEKQSTDDIGFAQFYWRKNYGIYMEMIVQESDYAYYFETFKQNTETPWRNKSNYNKIIPELGKILFVPDIVIFHKGIPKYVIEITHKHGLTKEKSELMKSFFIDCTNIVEIMADDILNLDCMKIPEKIKCLEW